MVEVPAGALPADSVEADYSRYLLPLPIDQRYTPDDMRALAALVLQLKEEGNPHDTAAKVSVLISFYNLAPSWTRRWKACWRRKNRLPRGNPLRGRRRLTTARLKAARLGAAHPDTVRVFVMDRVPGKKYGATSASGG